MTYALLILGAAVAGALIAYQLLLLALRIILAAFDLGRALINYRKQGDS